MDRSEFEVDAVAHVIDKMDPQMRANLESSYREHLKPRARDWISQTTALQSLQSATEASESQVMNVRGIVRESTTSLMLTVPRYNVAAAGASMPTLAMRSVAESTIQNHTPIKTFDWEIGMCFGCGANNHVWYKKGNVVCPNANRPGTKEYAEENYKKYTPKTRCTFDGGTITPQIG